MSRDVQSSSRSRSSRRSMDKGIKGGATETQATGKVHRNVSWWEWAYIIPGDGRVEQGQVVRAKLNLAAASGPPSPPDGGEKSPKISKKDISARRAHRDIARVPTALKGLGVH